MSTISRITLMVALLVSVAGAGPRPQHTAFLPSPDAIRDQTPSLDVLHYELDITLLPDAQQLEGLAYITLQSVTETLNEIPLNLVSLSVQGVTEGVDSVSFAPTSDGVVLYPDQPVGPGQVRTFVVQYGGHPTPEPGGAPWGGFFFAPNMAYSVGVGLYADPPSMGRHWFPGHDVPSDKATSDVTLRVPEGWIGISNGALVSDTTEEGARIMRWVTEIPIATYLMAIAGGTYVEIADSSGTTPIRHYVLPSLVDRARASFVHVPQMIDLYTRLFGPYPFERFGFVSSSLSGGMEHQTMVTLGSFAIDGMLTWESLVAHELAHQWWGDCVTYADWTQIWLSEGFATYGEALWAEENGGQAAYVASIMEMMQEYLGSGEDYFPLNEPDVLWGSATYEKGACVLHMLRQVLGDSLFYASLARYRALHEYGNATVDSLEEACEEATGLNVGWFFDQWVRHPGHPELAFRYAVYPCVDGDTGVDLEIRQLQDIGPVFRFPFEVACQTTDSLVRFSFFDSLPIQSASFRVPGELTGLGLDPDHDLLYRSRGTATADRVELAQVAVQDDGDHDGGLDPGEQADIVVGILNPFNGLGPADLELLCNDPDITVVSGTAHLDSLPAGAITANLADPFRIQCTPGMSNREIEASILLTTDSGATLTVTLPLYAGTAMRLVVDDAGPASAYGPYFLAAMDTLPDGRDREVWVTHRQGAPSATRVTKYADRGMVTWFTGDVDSMALDAVEVSSLQALLQAGGALFLTGQNAVDGLDEFPAGQTFLDSVLLIDVVDEDCSVTRAVLGEEGDPIGNGVAGVIQGNGGADNQTSLTVIECRQGSFPVMRYRNTELVCATRSSELGRVVIFSFGFEALNETQSQFTSREEMIRRVADWLEGPGTSADELPLPKPTVYATTPWRGVGGVHLSLPHTSPVAMALYDVLGRKTHVVFAGYLPAGESTVEMPDGIPSGAYLLLTRVGTEVVRSPIVVLP